MSALRDAADNIKQGFVRMWIAFPHDVRVGIIAAFVGYVFGAAMAMAFVC